MLALFPHQVHDLRCTGSAQQATQRRIVLTSYHQA
jgi:hypothetical protein